MKIIWSDFASQMLKEIFVYHKENVSHLVAKRIRNSIFQTTAKLKDYPHLGQIELNLSQLKENHRYLVSGNYKIVYKQVKEGVLITDVFDTRQDPEKINDTERKPTT